MPETQINLSDILNNYLKALQRVYDVMNYTLAAERCLTEQEYENYSRSNRVMPFQQTRMEFDTVKEETNTWLLKQTLNETLIILALFLDDCHSVAALASWQKDKNAKEADVRKKLQEAQAEFAKLELTDKVKHLREKYSITSNTEGHVASLYKARQALTNRDELVSDKNTTETGKLVLKLRNVIMKSAPADPNRPGGVVLTSELGDIIKEFPVGKKIRLNSANHIACILTVAFFITTEMQSLKECAEKMGVLKP